jgi:hypothetical protein
MRLPTLAIAALGLAAAANAASADTFAQFDQKNATNDFVFTPAIGSATFQTVQGGTAVSFLFNNLVGAPAGIQDAHLFLDADTTLDATVVNDSGDLILFQPFSHFVMTILRDSDSALLLRVTLTPANSDEPANLVGLKFDHSAALDASTAAIPANTVIFESDFADLSVGQHDAALSFSSVDPQLIDGRHFLEGFSAAGTGTFSTAIPEPASLTLVSLAGLALIRRRK